jgi:protoheme IX farnesyltransferase
MITQPKIESIEMKNRTIRMIVDYSQLCRQKIAIFAAVSAGCGLLLAGCFDVAIMASLMAGVFVLASGASGLNQYQERRTDALMPRTEKRPIPYGRISGIRALYFSAVLITTGLGILYFLCGLIPAVLGLLATIWYNGVYTSLKKISAFAAVPGGLTGALVPAIGWTAGSGSLNDPRLAAICILFGLWQVPHFWLMVLDNGKEYEAAGLPSITMVFSNSQIARITFIWITATAVCAPMLLLFTPASAVTQYLILCFSLWLFWQGSRLLASSSKEESRLLFFKINSYMLAVIVLLSCDSLYLHRIDSMVAAAKQIALMSTLF